MFAFIIPHCPLSVKQKAKKLYQGSLAAPFGGGAPRSPRCPLWGKCREAAKGVSLVILSCCHSSNNTPCPYGLPAPPSGEPRKHCFQGHMRGDCPHPPILYIVYQSIRYIAILFFAPRRFCGESGNTWEALIKLARASLAFWPGEGYNGEKTGIVPNAPRRICYEV